MFVLCPPLFHCWSYLSDRKKIVFQIKSLILARSRALPVLFPQSPGCSYFYPVKKFFSDGEKTHTHNRIAALPYIGAGIITTGHTLCLDGIFKKRTSTLHYELPDGIYIVFLGNVSSSSLLLRWKLSWPKMGFSNIFNHWSTCSTLADPAANLLTELLDTKRGVGCVWARPISITWRLNTWATREGLRMMAWHCRGIYTETRKQPTIEALIPGSEGIKREAAAAAVADVAACQYVICFRQQDKESSMKFKFETFSFGTQNQ